MYVYMYVCMCMCIDIAHSPRPFSDKIGRVLTQRNGTPRVRLRRGVAMRGSLAGSLCTYRSISRYVCIYRVDPSD